jgi:uncharacterized protein YndB with AHSA1/START domain
MSAISSPSTYLNREFVITRVFNAPRELVFKAWTDPKHLSQWWGPKGFTNPICQWDARPGGKIYDVMRAPDGTEHPMGGEYREIVEPEKLVISCGALDDKGKMLFEFVHTATFSEKDGKTEMVLHSRVTMTTPEADKYIGGFEMGMSMSLDRLTELLESADTTDGEIKLSRVFDAPREMIWDAMTDPKQIVKWWGPRGFSTTIQTMDVKPGGHWKLIMHGPDGTDYPNASVFKTVEKPQRLVFLHGGAKQGGPAANFEGTWTFDTVENGKTKVTIHMVFPTAAERDAVVKEYGAIEGGKQTLERLGEHLSVIKADLKELVVTRTFSAPRELVWKAWTERARLMEWFGPKGWTISVANLDFRPGGTFHYSMKTPDGKEMWGKFVYREIMPPEKIVLVNSFSDANGGMTRHPMSASWPLEMLTTTTFTEENGKTTITLRWLPLNPTAEERKTFDTSREGMNMGWKGTFDQLEEYLAKG